MRKRLIRLIIKIMMICIAVLAINQYVFKLRIIHDNNMYPSIRDGQLVVVYQLGEPNKDDIVLYKMNGKEKLGRILAQNETVDIDENGNITVNDNTILNTIPFMTAQGSIKYPYSEPGFFILNDYREDLSDSRTDGTIQENDIIGKVVFAMQYRGF